MDVNFFEKNYPVSNTAVIIYGSDMKITHTQKKRGSLGISVRMELSSESRTPEVSKNDINLKISLKNSSRDKKKKKIMELHILIYRNFTEIFILTGILLLAL